MHPPTSPIQLLIIAAVVLVLFGRGKVSSLMGEVGKGIASFKKGMKEETESAVAETVADEPTRALPAPADKSPA